MMNVGDVKGEHLDTVVKGLDQTTTKNCLELGTYCGYSSIRMARNLPEGVNLYTVDVNSHTTEIAKKVATFAGVDGKIVHKVHENGLEGLLEDFKKLEIQFDFVFFDHLKAKYLPDLKLLESNGLIRNGTVIFGDNVLVPGAPEFQAYIKGTDRDGKKVEDCGNYGNYNEKDTELEYFKPVRKDIVIWATWLGPKPEPSEKSIN